MEKPRWKLRLACRVFYRGKRRLIDLLSNDPEIAQILDRSAIARLIDPTNYLGNSGSIVDRVLAGKGDCNDNA
jgi:3-carboxy-cis,cis-muconate cycloisomerase